MTKHLRLHACVCQNADPTHCTAHRHEAAVSLVLCLKGQCGCQCHYDARGNLIDAMSWLQSKYAHQLLRWQPGPKEVK